MPGRFIPLRLWRYFPMTLSAKLANLSALSRIPGCEYRNVFSPIAYCGGYRFVHGPAVRSFEGTLYCTFAFNQGAENSIDEQLLVSSSPDGGDTWAVPVSLIENEPGRAHSHGTLFINENRLYCAAPSCNGSCHWREVCCGYRRWLWQQRQLH